METSYIKQLLHYNHPVSSMNIQQSASPFSMDESSFTFQHLLQQKILEAQAKTKEDCFARQSTFSTAAHIQKSPIQKTSYESIIKEMASKYGVDPQLIKSVIKHESGFNANAK